MKFYEASALVCRWRSDVDTAELQEPLFDVPELFSILKQHNMKVAIIWYHHHWRMYAVVAD